MGNKSFKNKFSFFYTVIVEVILGVITFLFLREYIALVLIILIISIVLLKENFWSFVAAVFTGLGFDMYYSGNTENLLILIFVLILGSFSEIIFNYARKTSMKIHETDSTFWNKVMFTFLCLPISIGFLFLRITLSEINHTETQKMMSEMVAVPVPDATQKMLNLGFDVFFSYLDDFFMTLSANSFLSGFNQLIVLILWLLVIMPWFWAGIMTAIKYAKFNFGKGNKIFTRSFLAYIGQLVFLPVTLIAAFIVNSSFIFFNLPMLAPLYFPDFALVGSTAFTAFALSFFTSIGAVWGAGWVKT
jgi:hypothetical protein